MNFFDDLRTRVEQSGQAIVSDLRSYYESQVITPLVRAGQAATGNLSAAQIKAGQVAESPPIAPPQNAVVKTGINLVSLLAIGAIGYLLLSPKGKGK